jgi:hypothetical protein
MLTKPIDQIQFDDVDQFCRSGAREGLLLDYKAEFPARLEKPISAFANTFGGHILIGVGEETNGQAQVPVAGVTLVRGLRERVVSTALQAIYPPVYPETRVIEFASPGNSRNDRAVIVVRIHESDGAAHAINQGTDVYLRIDNITDPYRRASVQEIEWFSEKRKRCTELKDQTLMAAQLHAQHYLLRLRAHHRWSTGTPRCRLVCWSVPMYPKSELSAPEAILRTAPLHRVQVGQATLPHDRDPIPVQGGVRFPSVFTPNFYYTEVNAFGLIYSEVGIGNPDHANSDSIHCGLIASVLAAALKYAVQLYESVGYFGLVEFQLQLSPALDLYLNAPDVMGMVYREEYRSMEQEVKIRLVGSVKDFAEHWLAKSMGAYKEFLWSFGWNASEPLVASHFNQFGIN